MRRFGEMFGLDEMFDMNKNGKLDAFENAVKLEFLDTMERDSKARKRGSKSSYDLNDYDQDDQDGEDY